MPRDHRPGMAEFESARSKRVAKRFQWAAWIILAAAIAYVLTQSIRHS